MSWRPTASLANLQRRAAALARVRAFFAQRAVMEVDTPLIVNAPVSDVHIHSAEVHFPDAAEEIFFLHTSPEFAMKRLLAAGSGDIYQVCHVARGLECGRYHNAEFTLIEWYRLGFSLDRLMDEVEALVRDVLGSSSNPLGRESLTYQDAVTREVGLDPLTCAHEELVAAAQKHGFAGANADSTRDELLDFLVGSYIGPRLGRGALTFIHRYPASQAALARLDPKDSRVALRFELYCEGIELANGFHELASGEEQRTRFEQDIEERKRRGLPTHAYDERLLAALVHGLPECSGVALGFDRLLMLASDAKHIDEVLPFPTDYA